MTKNLLREFGVADPVAYFFRDDRDSRRAQDIVVIDAGMLESKVVTKKINIDGIDITLYQVGLVRVDEMVGKLRANLSQLLGEGLVSTFSHFSPVRNFVVGILSSRTLSSVVCYLANSFSALGKKQDSVKYTQITEAESFVLDVLCNWNLEDGEEWVREKMNPVCPSLQACYISLSYVVYFKLDWEDVCGVLNNKGSDTIMLIIQNTAMQIIRSIFIREGYFNVEDSPSLIDYLDRVEVRPHLRHHIDQIEELFSSGYFDAQSLYLRSSHVFSEAVSGCADNAIAKVGLEIYDRNCVSDTSTPTKGETRIPITRVVDDEYIDNMFGYFQLSRNKIFECIYSNYEFSMDDVCIKVSGSIGDGVAHERSDVDIIALVKKTPKISGNSFSVTSGHAEVVFSSLNRTCIAFVDCETLMSINGWIISMMDIIQSNVDVDTCKASLLGEFRNELFKLSVDVIYGYLLKGSDPWDGKVLKVEFCESVMLYYMFKLDEDVKTISSYITGGPKGSIALRIILRHVVVNLLRINLTADDVLYKNDKWGFELCGRDEARYRTVLEVARKYLVIAISSFDFNEFILDIGSAVHELCSRNSTVSKYRQKYSIISFKDSGEKQKDRFAFEETKHAQEPDLVL